MKNSGLMTFWLGALDILPYNMYTGHYVTLNRIRASMCQSVSVE